MKIEPLKITKDNYKECIDYVNTKNNLDKLYSEKLNTVIVTSIAIGGIIIIGSMAFLSTFQLLCTSILSGFMVVTSPIIALNKFNKEISLELKNTYPNLRSKWNSYEIIDALEKSGILKYQSENRLSYEIINPSKLEEIKSDIINPVNRKYASYTCVHEISDEQLKKSKQKVKK